MENVRKSKKVLEKPEVSEASKKVEPKNERVLEEAEGRAKVRIEAFPKRERLPILPFEALQYPNKIRILGARVVDTVFGSRKVVDIEVLESECPNVKKGKYSLWCSRMGLERIFEQLGEIYENPIGMVVEIREAGKIGRAYNYVLEVLKEG